MTADNRRAQRARASELALAPPASTVYPPTLAQLLAGWPLVWNNVYRDAPEWAISLSRNGLPEPVRAVVDAATQTDPLLPGFLALADTCDAVVRERGLPDDVLDRVQEIGARARFACMWLGHYPSTCIVMHLADVAAVAEVDDAKRRAFSVTVGEASYIGHQQLLGLYRPDVPVHRRHARESGWYDLCARAETTEFMRGVDAGTGLGQVRDDTGLDPRDRDEDRAERIVSDLLDEAAEADAGVVVFPKSLLDAVGKSELRRDIERALGKSLGAPLRRIAVPEDWNAWERGLAADAPWLAPLHRAVRAGQGGRSHWDHDAILVVGAAGAGKSREGGRIAAASGLPTGRFNLDSSSDNSLGGTPARWSTGHLSFAERTLAAAQSATALLQYDEADKAAGSRGSGGHPYDVLHGLLERETAVSWKSTFLLGDVDLGHNVHLLTANTTDGIPSSLLDRLTIVRVGEPGPEHLGLLAPALARQACRELGLDERWGDLDREEFLALQDAWNGGSVRRLQRLVARLLQARDLPTNPVARH
ncbi:MAG: hypothetical protein PGN33_21995 [Methylobacterium radiotolerans]